MIELRDRFKTLAQGTSSAAALPQIQFVSNSPVAEAEAALQSLGYKPLEAQKLLRRLKPITLNQPILFVLHLNQWWSKHTYARPSNQWNRKPEDHFDRAIRPTSLADYIGQPVVREQMEIFIGAARGRGEALDHTLILVHRA